MRSIRFFYTAGIFIECFDRYSYYEPETFGAMTACGKWRNSNDAVCPLNCILILLVANCIASPQIVAIPIQVRARSFAAIISCRRSSFFLAILQLYVWTTHLHQLQGQDRLCYH